MSKLDLLLVNPAGRVKVYQSLSEKLAAVEPPIWAGLIANFVRNRGLSVEILDAEAEEMGPEEVAKAVEDRAPRLVALMVYGHQPSASTQTMPAASAVCDAIKQRTPEQRIMLGGTHPSALPERTLSEESVDFVCDGEGPHTILGLLQLLRQSQCVEASDYSKVGNLWYVDDGVASHGTPGPLMRDLDTEVLGLAWDLLPMTKYRAHNWHCFGNLQREPYAAIYTTLGCPYHCSFCCIQAPFKSSERASGIKETVNSYRFWSPDWVIGQIDVLVNEYGVRNIKIEDEMFVLNPRHVLGICDKIIERGYDLNIWAYARVDTVRDNMLDKLKQAGFNWLAFGIEAGSERVRNDADKSLGQDEIVQTIQNVRQAGINVIGNYIFGLPEDDMETMQETLDLALDLNCEFANFYCAMAYPGSPLYRLALREGWQLPHDWSGYSQHSVDSLPLPTLHVSASDVLRFRDEAFNTYFTSPRYLDMVKTQFGDATVDHIREMAGHKLERQYV